jgi:hypothetical protein
MRIRASDQSSVDLGQAHCGWGLASIDAVGSCKCQYEPLATNRHSPFRPKKSRRYQATRACRHNNTQCALSLVIKDIFQPDHCRL